MMEEWNNGRYGIMEEMEEMEEWNDG